MDHSTRLMPRRLFGGSVFHQLALRIENFSFIFPKM